METDRDRVGAIDLFVRLLRVKEELLLSIPEYRIDAALLQKQLHPHEGSAIHKNVQIADKHAQKWLIPYNSDAQRDPCFLACNPFSCNYLITAEDLAVQQIDDVDPPLLKLVIDVRFSDSHIRQRVMECVQRVRAELGPRPSMRQWEREAEAWEKRLAVHRLREEGYAYAEIPKFLNRRASEEDLRRLGKEATDALAEHAYRDILPMLNRDVFHELNLATARFPYSPLARPPMTVTAQVIVEPERITP